MTKFFARHEPFLQSRASLLVVGLCTDGIVLNPVISRLMQMHPSNHIAYRELTQKSELMLGDMLLHQVQKQTTGLGVGSNKGFDYIANLMVSAHPKDPTKLSAFTKACQTLNPKLFELMRYKNLRHIAIYTGNLMTLESPFMADSSSNLSPKQPLAAQIWQIVCQTLQVPRISVDVHFDKSIEISQLVFEESTQP